MKPNDRSANRSIDELYGLEPVFEPGSQGTASDPSPFVAVQCPHCGEPFETAVDLSAGSFTYIEDCPVCCRPIELSGDVDDSGALVGVAATQSG